MEDQGQLIIMTHISDFERDRTRKMVIHKYDCLRSEAIDAFKRFQKDNPHITQMFAHWAMYPVRIK